MPCSIDTHNVKIKRITNRLCHSEPAAGGSEESPHSFDCQCKPTPEILHCVQNDITFSYAQCNDQNAKRKDLSPNNSSFLPPFFSMYPAQSHSITFKNSLPSGKAVFCPQKAFRLEPAKPIQLGKEELKYSQICLFRAIAQKLPRIFYNNC